MFRFLILLPPSTLVTTFLDTLLVWGSKWTNWCMPPHPDVTQGLLRVVRRAGLRNPETLGGSSKTPLRILFRCSRVFGSGWPREPDPFSRTSVETTADPNAGRQTSFNRKRDDSPSDFAHNARPFGDGNSLSHYLTVSPDALLSSSYTQRGCGFLNAGNMFCGQPTIDRGQTRQHLGCTVGVSPFHTEHLGVACAVTYTNDPGGFRSPPVLTQMLRFRQASGRV